VRWAEDVVTPYNTLVDLVMPVRQAPRPGHGDAVVDPPVDAAEIGLPHALDVSLFAGERGGRGPMPGPGSVHGGGAGEQRVVGSSDGDRGRVRGVDGLPDLSTSRKLVTGSPLSRVREFGYGWLPLGLEWLYAAVIEVAHLVATWALQAGDNAEAIRA
jgi:hypothetical protein